MRGDISFRCNMPSLQKTFTSTSLRGISPPEPWRGAATGTSMLLLCLRDGVHWWTHIRRLRFAPKFDRHSMTSTRVKQNEIPILVFATMIKDVRNMRANDSEIEDEAVCLLCLRAPPEEYSVFRQTVEREQVKLTIDRLRTELRAKYDVQQRERSYKSRSSDSPFLASEPRRQAQEGRESQWLRLPPRIRWKLGQMHEQRRIKIGQLKVVHLQGDRAQMLVQAGLHYLPGDGA